MNGKDQGGFANIVGNGTNGGGVIRVAGEGPFNTSGNVQNKLTAFAPRLGLAYQVTPRTVVRMGYGRSFDIGVFGSNFGHTVTQNLPVLVNQSISVSNLPGKSGASDNLLPVFTLNQGPPAYVFPTQLSMASFRSKVRLTIPIPRSVHIPDGCPPSMHGTLRSRGS